MTRHGHSLVPRSASPVFYSRAPSPLSRVDNTLHGGGNGCTRRVSVHPVCTPAEPPLATARLWVSFLLFTLSPQGGGWGLGYPGEGRDGGRGGVDEHLELYALALEVPEGVEDEDLQVRRLQAHVV